MKNKIIECLNSLDFTLLSDDTAARAARKIFVYDNVLVTVEERKSNNK